MTRVALPLFFDTGEVKFVVEKYQQKYFEDVFDLFRKCSTEGTGVSEGEFYAKEDLKAHLGECFFKATFHDCEQNDKLFGFFTVRRTKKSRSVLPAYASQYLAVDPAYKGKGITEHMLHFYRDILLDAGMSGVLGGMALTSHAGSLVSTAGLQVVGAVPQAVKIFGKGWVPEIIVFLDLVPTMTAEEKAATRLMSAPVPPKDNSGVTSLLPVPEALFSTQDVVTRKGFKTKIKGANLKEVYIVESMIRSCAMEGDGFNLDEFDPDDGHFLHKFIHEPKVLVATDSSGRIIAAAMCGLSTLTREPGSLYSAYFIVERKSRRKGIAGALLNAVSKMSQKEGCDLLLFDVFVTNHVAMDWLRRSGFIATGCFPNCGYIAGKGYTHSLIMYKCPNDFSNQSGKECSKL